MPLSSGHRPWLAIELRWQQTVDGVGVQVTKFDFSRTGYFQGWLGDANPLLSAN
jgi:hypothetical protein